MCITDLIALSALIWVVIFSGVGWYRALEAKTILQGKKGAPSLP